MLKWWKAGCIFLSCDCFHGRLLIILLFLLLQVTLKMNSSRIQHAVQCLGLTLCVLLQLLSSFYTLKWKQEIPSRSGPIKKKKITEKLNIPNCFIYSRTVYSIVTFSYQNFFFLIWVKLLFVWNYGQIIKFVKHGISSDDDCSSAVQKTDPVLEPEDSLPYAQESVIYPCLEPDKSNPNPHPVFLHYSWIDAKTFTVFSSLHIVDYYFDIFLNSSYVLDCPSILSSLIWRPE
jgi:hypothetical protein